MFFSGQNKLYTVLISIGTLNHLITCGIICTILYIDLSNRQKHQHFLLAHYINFHTVNLYTETEESDFVHVYIPLESSSTIITVVVAVDRITIGLEVVRLTENCSSSSSSVSCVIWMHVHILVRPALNVSSTTVEMKSMSAVCIERK